MYDIDHGICKLRTENISESVPCSYEATKVVAKKALGLVFLISFETCVVSLESLDDQLLS